MYQLKQLPEDFIVQEISDAKAGNGQYAYYTLKKTNYTTVHALEILSKKLNAPLKHFGFAGNKDKNAVTEQKISIFRGSKNLENLKIKNIGLKYLGKGKSPISLGDLDGNGFIITIRNLDNAETKKIEQLENKTIRVPNLFGPQRFGRNNQLVGKAIIKKDFKKAVELISENSDITENEIRSFLAKHPNNYVEALKIIPLKTRKLFVHSYQSFLFNKIIDEFLKNAKTEGIGTFKIPVIGFDFQCNSIKTPKLKKIIKKLIEEEKISPRDFIIPQLPELTSEGTSRDLFFEFNFKIIEAGIDDLNKDKQKVKISFALPKSCYATVAVEFVFRQ